VKERLAQLEEIPLLTGGHEPPPPSCDAPEGCAEEIYTWLFDLPWSDRPNDTVSPVISAFMRRLNDELPDDLRQKLKPYLVKQHGTANDGHDELRGWLCANWTIRVGLPAWLELAGVTDAVEALRELPEVTDRETLKKARTQLRSIRNEMWELRKEARTRLADRIAEELKKWGIKKPAAAAAAAAAVAAAVADAVADADAAAAADAAAVAAAVAVAVAAAAADAAADAAAVADAAADAVADSERWWAIRGAVYTAIRPKVEEITRPVNEALFPSALELLDRLIDPTAVKG
jgi:hypothetical protein